MLLQQTDFYLYVIMNSYFYILIHLFNFIKVFFKTISSSLIFIDCKVLDIFIIYSFYSTNAKRPFHTWFLYILTIDLGLFLLRAGTDPMMVIFFESFDDAIYFFYLYVFLNYFQKLMLMPIMFNKFFSIFSTTSCPYLFIFFVIYIVFLCLWLFERV